ncbi:MAG: hypothetical protein KGJ41_04350 [Rhodospirillales bacterium]|nr:hypothetical protein [Rhodospirillales bacterium]MDE2576640.1 hypothetical protein [Rhodospirillales bacterium]
MEFADFTEAMIAAWNGIAPPNETARRMAADLAASLDSYARQRERMAFEDEPASFIAALHATREAAP